jgi:2-dehydro-3-deoxyphosphogluconate aldolase / (4S)-4-hydroxy-2-oxoglutarate aldolase
MNRAQNLDRLLSDGLVAILRTNTAAPLDELVSVLVEAGVETIEITLTIPGALAALERLSAQWGGRVLLGAGTVLDAPTARLAILAGARFLVSPCVDLPTIEMCHRYDVLAIPGALTPTEVLAAWNAGADIVKIFPSDVMGPDYFAAIRRPLPQIRMMPTGGITLDSIPQFIAAGACAIGAGGTLTPATAVQTRDWAHVTELARQFRAAISRARQP